MSDATILEALARAGHGAFADDLRAALRPGIHLTATALAGRPADWRRADDEEEGDDDDAGDDGAPDRVAAFDAAMAALPLGATRFGGLPDLPPGAVVHAAAVTAASPWTNGAICGVSENSLCHSTAGGVARTSSLTGPAWNKTAQHAASGSMSEWAHWAL